MGDLCEHIERQFSKITSCFNLLSEDGNEVNLLEGLAHHSVLIAQEDFSFTGYWKRAMRPRPIISFHYLRVPRATDVTDHQILQDLCEIFSVTLKAERKVEEEA